MEAADGVQTGKEAHEAEKELQMAKEKDPQGGTRGGQPNPQQREKAVEVLPDVQGEEMGEEDGGD